jgi:hypothetical protein
MEVSGQRHDPAALYPGESTSGTLCTGGWAGPRAGLDTEDKSSCLCRRSYLYRPVVQSVVRLYNYCAVPASDFRHRLEIRVQWTVEIHAKPQ